MAEDHTQEDRGEPTPPWSVDLLSREYVLAIEDDKEFIDMLFAFALNPSRSFAILGEDWVLPRLGLIASRNSAVFNNEFLRVIELYFRGQSRTNLLKVIDDAKKRQNGHNVFHGQTLETLLQTYYPEPQWAVHGLIPEGCLLMAGKPKQGKSYLALHIALSVAKRQLCLGEFVTTGGDVLYFSLEDYAKRIQRRVQQLYAPDDSPHTIEFFYHAPKMGSGFAEGLMQTLQLRPSIRLVVIDTLRCIRESSKDSYNLYQEDSDFMGILNQCAQDAGMTILVVHHTRKAKGEDVFDEISGTGGLRGGTSGNLILEPTQDDADALLHVEGKDFDKRLVIAMKRVSDGSWIYTGEGDAFKLRSNKRAIMQTITNLGDDARPKEIWQNCGIKEYSTVRTMLSRMASLGEIGKSQRGIYFLIDDGGIEV